MAILIPESLNAGIDALGNALTPRTSKTFNADGSGYALVPDDNSLDLTTEATWAMKGNFYGTATAGNTLIGRWNDTITKRSLWIYRISGSLTNFRLAVSSDGTAFATANMSITDEVGWAVITFNAGAVKMYWKGDLLVDTTLSQTSIYVTDEDMGICANVKATIRTDINTFPVSDIKIYNRELTADEVATFV